MATGKAEDEDEDRCVDGDEEVDESTAMHLAANLLVQQPIPSFWACIHVACYAFGMLQMLDLNFDIGPIILWTALNIVAAALALWLFHVIRAAKRDNFQGNAVNYTSTSEIHLNPMARKPKETHKTTALVHDRWCNRVEASESPTLKPKTVQVNDEVIVVSQEERQPLSPRLSPQKRDEMLEFVQTERQSSRYLETRNSDYWQSAHCEQTEAKPDVPRAKAKRRKKNRLSAPQTVAQKTAMLPPPPRMPPQGVASTNQRHTAKKQTKSSESADDFVVI